MSWHHYGDYIPVAQRRAQALKKTAQHRAAQEDIQPIGPLNSRGLIAKSFWGKAWCKHMQTFSDYENRLPRGRSYVRNGAVFHLAIQKGIAHAKVSGSSSYDLSIHFEPLDPEKWSTIKNLCKGKIGSLIELLQGKISNEIMTIVTDPENGLFPHPKEIRFNCNCPDWADMCKHVAAAMYGIGVRLDTEPELLFKLRGVNHEELIQIAPSVDEIAGGKRSRRRRTLKADALENVFGVELDVETKPTFEATGAGVRALRATLNLSQAAFARNIGVSTPSISNWEKTDGPLNLKPKSFQALETAFNTIH